jgi:hypothetical protein
VSLIHALPGILQQQGASGGGPTWAGAVTARLEEQPAGASGGTTAKTSASFTPTADSLLVSFSYAWSLSNSSLNATLDAISGSVLTFTELQSVEGADAPSMAEYVGYELYGSMSTAPVGGSPASMTLTGAAISTNNSVKGLIAVDVTGLDASPVVQSAKNFATVGPGETEVGTVTLGAAPTAGTVLIVAFASTQDTAPGQAFTAPTAGSGKTFTEVYNASPVHAHTGLWYRACDGTESATITCSDLGQDVQSYVAFAVELTA